MITVSDVLDKYKKSNKLKEKFLTYSHTTSYKTFVKHIFPNKNKIKGKECDYHNNEKLVFLFYGKATYFPPNLQGDQYTNNPPITFIYSDELFSDITIRRLCCFDSGAYISGFFTEGVKPDQELLKNYIKEYPIKEDFIALVQLLYKTNINYLGDELELFYNINDYPLSTCLVTINDMFINREALGTNYGPQAFSIEVQVEGELKKDPYALVVPKTLASSIKAIDEWEKKFPKTKVMFYENRKKDTSSYTYNLMREKVVEFNKHEIL